jgi:hypothetical protein
VKRPDREFPRFDLARAAEVRRWRDRLPLSLSLDTIGDENLADAAAVRLCVETRLRPGTPSHLGELLMKTYRAKVSFIVKENEAAPMISIEQFSGDNVLLEAAHGIYLELAPDTALEDAHELAAVLRKKVKSIARLG